MDAAGQQAAQAMYAALSTMPCTCKRAGLWPFRGQVLVNGKLENPPDLICRRCSALSQWEAAVRSEAT